MKPNMNDIISKFKILKNQLLDAFLILNEFIDDFLTNTSSNNNYFSNTDILLQDCKKITNEITNRFDILKQSVNDIEKSYTMNNMSQKNINEDERLKTSFLDNKKEEKVVNLTENFNKTQNYKKLEQIIDSYKHKLLKYKKFYLTVKSENDFLVSNYKKLEEATFKTKSLLDKVIHNNEIMKEQLKKYKKFQQTLKKN